MWGFEHRGTAPWGPHNATIPFTRFIAGNGDYTPTVFGDRRRETSWPHQIASAIVFTSTLLVYGGHPQSFLDNPALEIIKMDRTAVAAGDMLTFELRARGGFAARLVPDAKR